MYIHINTHAHAHTHAHTHTHTQDHPDTASLARYLIYLDNNATAYAEYFTWKKLPPRDSFLALLPLCSNSFFCRTCSLVRRWRSRGRKGVRGGGVR